MTNDADALDPVRRLILERAKELRISLAELSQACGRNPAYLQQYIWRRSPKRLGEAEREAIARALQLPDDSLRETNSTPKGEAVRVRPFVAPAISSSGRLAARQVPVYSEGAPFEPSAAKEFTAPPLADSGVIAAIWIKRPRGRLCPGDMIYLTDRQPPRPGDVAALIDGTSIVAIGDVEAMDDESVTISGTTHPLPASAHLLKVAFTRLA